MSGNDTVTMLDMYEQKGTVTRFLSSFFQSPRRNFFKSKGVEIDVKRGDESIAIPRILGTGPNMNSLDTYTNKLFIPPAFDEGVALDAFSTLERMAGNNPFDDADWRADTLDRMMSNMENNEDRIRRTVELQAAQVLQTGAIDLKNTSSVTQYTIDYLPKSTHFTTVTTSWSAAGADPIADLLPLINVIRNDGLRDPRQLIFAENSFEQFIANAKVQPRVDQRRADLGAIVPIRQGVEGQQYRGTLDMGNYKMDLFTYGGRYVDPTDGATKQYIEDDKVIVKVADARFDLVWGAVPNFRRILGQAMFPELGGGRFSSSATGIDMFVNIYMTDSGRDLIGEVASRPLCIPTAIDQYGCLTTKA